MGDPQWLLDSACCSRTTPGLSGGRTFGRQNCWLSQEERWRDETTALGDQHDVLRASIKHYLTGG
jgi:hypothetical protein